MEFEMEDEIVLKVEDKQFIVNKQVLSNHSDYFRAMFSGNFKEHDQQEITIDIVDATSMELITTYLSGQLRNLSNYPLSVIGNLAQAASVLQFTELAKEIESFLELEDITIENWIRVVNIAEHMNYTKIKKSCVDFGVPPLNDMKVQYVQSIQDLVWYLSQTYLYVLHESDVFKFALDWMSYFKTAVDPQTLLMFLGCLDFNRVANDDLVAIKNVCVSLFGFLFYKGLAAKVVDCLIELSKTDAITTTLISSKEMMISEKYTKDVFKEVQILVESSRSKIIKHTPVISVFEDPKRKKMKRMSGMRAWSLRSDQDFTSLQSTSSSEGRQGAADIRTIQLMENEISNQLFVDSGYNLYTYTDAGLEKWLELKISKTTHLYYYTWGIAAWGPRNLVLVVSKGKIKENQQSFKKLDEDSCTMEVKTFNILKKKWMPHMIRLPGGMVRRLAVVRHSLYIICGFGYNIIYNLTKGTYKIIAELPFKILEQPDLETRMPLICVHNDEVYISDLHVLYKYQKTSKEWVKVIEHHTRITNLMSHDDGYIYVTDASDNNLRRFKPGEDARIEIIQDVVADDFSPIINSCSIEDRLLFFTNKTFATESLVEPSSLLGLFEPSTEPLKRTLCIHKYSTKSDEDNQFKEVWTLQNTDLKFDPYRNACRLIFTTPTVDADVTEYLKQCLMKYNGQAMF